MRVFVCALLLVLVSAVEARAQCVQPPPPLRNPSGLCFTSADHANVTAYEIDIVKTSDGAVLQTITVPKTSTTMVGTEVRVDVNVQPVAFGTYTFRARAVVNTVKSTDSVPSDQWDRAPGQPSKPKVARAFRRVIGWLV
jgi:hypothetical protein